MKPDGYIVKAYILLLVFLFSIFLFMSESVDMERNGEGMKFELYDPSA